MHQQRQYGSDFGRFEKQSDEQFESNTNEYQEPPKSSKPQTKNMLVLDLKDFSFNRKLFVEIKDVRISEKFLETKRELKFYNAGCVAKDAVRITLCFVQS